MDKTTRPIVGILGLTEPERQRVVDLLPPLGTLLEIGTADGATAAWIADRRPAATIVSVDLFPNPTGGVQGIIGNVDQWMVNRRHNMRLFVGTAKQLEVFSVAHVFDVVLVDGEHTYDSANADILEAEMLVRWHGVICLHDFEHRDNGVKRAYNKTIGHNWPVTRVQGSMAILHRLGDDSERMKRLKELGYA